MSTLNLCPEPPGNLLAVGVFYDCRRLFDRRKELVNTGG